MRDICSFWWIIANNRWKEACIVSFRRDSACSTPPQPTRVPAPKTRIGAFVTRMGASDTAHLRVKKAHLRVGSADALITLLSNAINRKI